MHTCAPAVLSLKNAANNTWAGFAAASQKMRSKTVASLSRSLPASSRFRSLAASTAIRANARPRPHAVVTVQRTAIQMRRAGFRDVRMFEILSRNMDCAPCEATAAVLDEESSISTPKTTHPIKRLREAAQSSTGAASLSIVSRPPKEEPGHTGYLLFGTLCLPPLEQQ